MTDLICGSLLQLEIDKFAHLGHGISRVKGFTVFVPDSVPGDIIEAEITSISRNYAFARIVKIIKPSPFRVSPACPVYDNCGGCDFMRLSYDRQLFFKSAVVHEEICHALQQPPRFHEIKPSSPERFRHKSILRHDKNRGFGFYARHTNSVVSIPYGDKFCLIQPVKNQEILRNFLELFGKDVLDHTDEITLRNSYKTAETLLILTGKYRNFPRLSDNSELLNRLGISGVLIYDNERIRNVYGNDFYHDNLNRFKYQICAECFFQTNPAVAEKMQDTMLELLNGNTFREGLDLYAGIGTFSLPLASVCQTVTAVESFWPSSKMAQTNARINSVHNMHPVSGNVLHRLESFSFRMRPAVCVVDPPRKGMHVKALSLLIKAAPDAVIYISCQLPTFIRDAKTLSENGYSFVHLHVFDMFPQTSHMELMGYFVRK